RPVEVLQPADLLEAGQQHLALQPAVVTPADFIGEQHFQEGGVIQLLPAGQGDPLGQGGQQSAQLQPLQQRRQVGGRGHSKLLWGCVGAQAGRVGGRCVWANTVPGRANRAGKGKSVAWPSGPQTADAAGGSASRAWTRMRSTRRTSSRSTSRARW